jgi:hypothetical protein
MSIGKRGYVDADSCAARSPASAARWTGQRDSFPWWPAKEFYPMDQRGAVMAYHGKRVDPSQSGSRPHGMLSRPVTGLGRNEPSRGEYAVGEPKPSAPADQAANLPTRHPRSRKLRRGHHPC